MALGNVKGITIEVAADTTKFDEAIKNAEKETAKIDTELKKVNKALVFSPTSVDLWRQKQSLLTQKISETETKLKSLKQKQAELDKDKSVDKNSKEYRELQREIIATESRLKTFKGQLREIGNAKLKALGEQFKQIGSKMTSVGRSLSMYVTAPIAGMGAASVKAGLEFDSAMSQVAATSGKTVGEIKDLRDFAKEMGSTTSFSATEAAQGLNYMALAGYDAEKSMKMLPTVLNLAAAGSMELASASDMVTDAQTALGLSLDETTTLVDEMAQTSSKSNTSVSQLGEAILKIGPTAKTMAGGTKELNTVLGLLADNGIKGTKAGTNLRNILLSMNTSKVKDAFHEMGVEVFDAQGNMRSLADIFPELSKAMDGLTSEERTGMLSKLFNKTDLAAINSLLDTSAERWGELGNAISGAEGSAEKMANTQLDNLKGSLTLLKSALEGAGIAISDVLAPYIRKLADFVSGLIAKFNKLSPSVQKIIVAVGAIVAALGPLLVIAGTIATSIGTILPMLGGIPAVVLPIVAVIGALVAIFASAYASSEDFRKAINGIVISLGQVFGPLVKHIVAEVKKLFAVIAQTASEVATELAPIFIALTPVFKAVAKVIAGVLKTKFDLIIKTIKLLCSAVKLVAVIMRSVLSSVVSITASTVTKIKNAFSKVKSALTGPFESAKNAIKAIVEKIKGFFGFSVKAPHIPLPHFSINPKGWDIGDLVKGKIPSLSVKWYAKGGIFKNPTVFNGVGVGEAGPEAVVPLKELWEHLDNLSLGSPVININGAPPATANEIAMQVKQILIQEEKRRRLAWQ